MWKKGIRVIVSFVVVLLVWQIACTVTNANATLFPSPVKVGEEFVKLFTQGLEGSTSHVTLPGHIRKNPAIKMITIAGTSPIPNQNTINGRNATGAIGRMI